LLPCLQPKLMPFTRFLWTAQQQDYGNHHIRPDDPHRRGVRGFTVYIVFYVLKYFAEILVLETTAPKGLRDGATSTIATHSASVSTWKRGVPTMMTMTSS
jgi:hypothetical protein